MNTVFHNSTLPVILAGDLNARQGSKPINELLAGGWIDSDTDGSPTIPSDNPRRRIDFVMYKESDPWRVVSVTVLDEPIASDHAPVLVVLEWTG